jgi:Ca2+-transporting ATPase
MIFMSLALLQLGNALAVRSDTHTAFRLGLLSNRLLVGAVFGTAVVQIGLPYIGAIRRFLAITSLSVGDLAITIGVSTIGFAAIEAEKALRRHRNVRALLIQSRTC